MKPTGAVDRGGRERRRRLGHLAGAAIALGLVAAVLAAAEPARVIGVLARTEPGLLGVAALIAGIATALRGLRLALLLPPRRLGPGRAALVAATAQAATLLMPLRLGELALPWLLRRTTAWDLSSGMGTLLVARVLDLATLGAWAGASLLLIEGGDGPLSLLVALTLLLAAGLALPLATGVEHCAVRLLAPRGQRWRRWARRTRRLGNAVREARQRPLRMAGAVLSSIAMWGCVWLYTWLELRAMDFFWPLSNVVVGSVAASIANLLPINLVGNLGPVEAGWAAAMFALGVPLEAAAASGLAAHLWAIAFVAVYGAIGWLGLLAMARAGKRESGSGG
jgi:hypothetical protein